ncbi:MAG: hypothetical protein ABSF61_14635 [Anaerolineales bacterium]
MKRRVQAECAMQSIIPHETIIKINTAKQRSLECQAAVGVIMGFGSAILAEKLPNLSFDFVLLERQRDVWDDQSSCLGFQAIRRGSAIPMARLTWNDPAYNDQMLDRGALGQGAAR